MASALMNKIYGLFNYGKEEDSEEYEDNDIDYGYEEEEEEEPETEKRFFGRKGKDKVVNLNPDNQIRMIIAKPTSFEQSEDICDCLKEKKSIIVNLEYVNKDVARRIVDFMSGAVQALNGHIEKISNSIFLFAPFNYEISNETTREELKNKLSVSWLKNG